CKLVRDKARLRELIRTCNQIVTAAAADDDDAVKVLSRAQQVINEVCTDVQKHGFDRIGDLADASYTRILALRNNEINSTGLHTGLDPLDYVTGGFQPSDLIIIAGRPGMGKSALAGQIALGMTKVNQSAVVSVFSLEMSKAQYTNRLISHLAKVNQSRMRNGTVNGQELGQIAYAAQELKNHDLVIDDTGSINASEIRAKVLKLKHDRGRLDAIVIDFLQRMTTAKKTESRQNEVSLIARDLKSLAKDLNVPVIALSSL